MVLTNHFYKVGREELVDRVQLLENRTQPMTAQYTKMFKKELHGIKLEGRVAVLYAGGAGVHNAEGRNYSGSFTSTQPIMEAGPVIKDLQAYMMHRYISMLINNNNIVYANINSNTCASSLYSIYEAEQLIEKGVVDHAIIISEEKTSLNTMRIFHEHNIPLKIGEGFACAVLSKIGVGTIIRDTKWEYKYNRNPFLVDEEGYSKVYTECDVVKGHQTGTVQNDEAEKAVFGDKVFGYKKDVGHTQGASGLIELCMLLDDESVKGNVLCTASGLGGFYGSCVVEK